uniref:Uncharacterized protein n=1 Tax=Arundo donax TaxID=35708 RepID=A0A0A9HWJ6_ARUDO
MFMVYSFTPSEVVSSTYFPSLVTPATRVCCTRNGHGIS